MSFKTYPSGRWEIGALFMKGQERSLFLPRSGETPAKYKSYNAVHFRDQTESKIVWEEAVNSGATNWRWYPMGTGGDVTMIMISNHDAEKLGLFEPLVNEFGIISP